MSYEYDFQGDADMVFAYHKAPNGSTLVAHPNQVVVTDYPIDHPLLRPRTSPKKRTRNESETSDPAPVEAEQSAAEEA